MAPSLLFTEQDCTYFWVFQIFNSIYSYYLISDYK